jgi:hypothetical protein
MFIRSWEGLLIMKIAIFKGVIYESRYTIPNTEDAELTFTRKEELLDM